MADPIGDGDFGLGLRHGDSLAAAQATQGGLRARDAAALAATGPVGLEAHPDALAAARHAGLGGPRRRPGPPF